MPNSITVRIQISEEKIYFPGETVTGFLVVTALKEIVVRDIKIISKGSAKVKWKRFDESRVSRTEKYYKNCFSLLESGHCSVLETGTHRFPFSFKLPSCIPCSFESKYGCVRHFCNAAVNVMGEFFDFNQYVLLSVGVPIDLNFDAISEKPINLRKESGTFPQGLSLSLNVDHSGFVPGEPLIVNAKCENRSKKSTRGTKLELFQVVKYKAEGWENKVEEKLLLFQFHKGIAPGADDIWSGQQWKFPPLPPTDLPECSIIKISYLLKFTCYTQFFLRNLSVSVPIKIGTIPLKETFRSFVPRNSDSSQNRQQVLNSTHVNGSGASNANASEPSFQVSKSTAVKDSGAGSSAVPLSVSASKLSLQESKSTAVKDSGAGSSAVSSNVGTSNLSVQLVKSFPWTKKYPDLAEPSYKYIPGNDAKHFHNMADKNFCPLYVYYNVA